ncbi:MAG: polyketide synthase dehydratase domain-containing protein [Candidatus Heimdallarchaeota archaeon]
MKESKLANDNSKFPLIGEITENRDELITCERTLALESDLYLDHHRFNNIPFLPGVMGLELFAELGKITHPDREISEFIDVEFCSAIRFKNDKPRYIKASLNLELDKADAILELLDKREDEGTCESRLCFKATINFNQRTTEKSTIPILKKMPFLNKQIIYQVLPHGPLFQVLSEINHIDNEVIAIGNFKKRQQFRWKHDKLVINPLTIEAGFQTIGLMDFIKTGKAGLPCKIDRLVFYKTDGKPHFVIGQKKPEENFNFEIITKKGEVVLKAENYQIIETKMGDTLSALERIRSHSIRLQYKMPKKAWLEVVSLRLLRDKISRESDFVKTFLQPDELVLLEGMVEEKRVEVISEKYALKRALRVVLFSPDMLRFEIQKDQNNEPFCQYKRKMIYLTTKKLDDYLLAMASYNRKVDIELQNE